MTTSTVIWIVIAVVAAIVLIAVIAFAARKTSNRRRRVEAERIRGEANQEMERISKREAFAEETAAKARAAQAEADAKAAEASRLHERVAAHRDDVSSARSGVQERLSRAESIDPASRRREAQRGEHDQADGDQAISRQREDVPPNAIGRESGDNR